MGARGPIGKRSNQLHGHRGKADLADYDRIPIDAPTVPAREPDPQWHPVAQEWFTSLAQSGQSVFYEPSDWATAAYVAEAMSRNLSAGKFSAQLFAAVMSGMSSLLTTEGDRRRVRLELERSGQAADPDAVLSERAVDDWLRQLTG